MKKTNCNYSGQKIAVSQQELAGMLGVGRFTADKIGKAAGARVKIGTRVLYRVEAVNEWLADQAEVEGM